MSIEYLTAFADFYDVSVEYLLGLYNSRKKEYHDISEQLGLCDKAIDELIQCKENSSSEEGQQLYVSQDTAILNDFLISAEFRRVMEKLRKSLLHITCTSCPRTASLHKYGKKSIQRWKKLRKFLDACGYCSVEYDLISQVHLGKRYRHLDTYLRELPETALSNTCTESKR